MLWPSRTQTHPLALTKARICSEDSGTRRRSFQRQGIKWRSLDQKETCISSENLGTGRITYRCQNAPGQKEYASSWFSSIDINLLRGSLSVHSFTSVVQNLKARYKINLLFPLCRLCWFVFFLFSWNMWPDATCHTFFSSYYYYFRLTFLIVNVAWLLPLHR